MSEQLDLSTLGERVRYAAEVIDELNAIRPPIDGGIEVTGRAPTWNGALLRSAALQCESNERAVAELAAKMFEVIAGVDMHEIAFAARALIRSGWRKA